MGPDSGVIQQLHAQESALPKPIQVRGQVDTGTLVTAVGPGTLAALGAIPGGAPRTQTASGIVIVQFYSISFTIFDLAGRGPTLARSTWMVTDLPGCGGIIRNGFGS